MRATGGLGRRPVCVGVSVFGFEILGIRESFLSEGKVTEGPSEEGHPVSLQPKVKLLLKSNRCLYSLYVSLFTLCLFRLRWHTSNVAKTKTKLAENISKQLWGSVQEAHIPMLNTKENKFANYSIIVKRVGYNGGLQSKFTSGSSFSHLAVRVDDLAREWGSFMADFFHKDVGKKDERLFFVNANQYKGILNRRQT